MIRLKDLRKRFGALAAVDSVSLDIEKGETFGLLGPNGAGKSTTIALVIGLLAPDSGTVEVAGRAGCPPGDRQTRRLIGIAPQALSLYLDLTGEENLRLFGRLQGLTGRKLSERVDWALDFAGLTERRHSRLSAYSGGMQRRLNLSAALIHDPPILLLDEPTVGVDPQSRNAIFDRIEMLQKDGRTILFTTHYMEEASRLCDRVAIMDHGKILALDTVAGLIAAHGGEEYVAVERPTGGEERVELEVFPAHLAALAKAGPLPRFRVERPDLECVFLNLTGRQLRD